MPRFAFGMPYFTEPDRELVRAESTRDPLGFLPVWSFFARRLVPYVASPVVQVDGIKAVLLILWLANDEKIAPMLAGEDARRKFFRLMEGFIEYWLIRNERTPCYGSNALRAGAEKFALAADSGQTVANGLYQYYRGTCRRAGFTGKDFEVDASIARELAAAWRSGATAVLAGALKSPLMGRQALVPAEHLRNRMLADAFKLVFAKDVLRERFQKELFGDAAQLDLARQYREMQAEAVHENISALRPGGLAHELRCVRDCEPFLLVMQNVFDVMRGEGKRKLDDVAARLSGMRQVMGERAAAFLRLGRELDTKRMRQMQELAAILAPQEQEGIVDFMRKLVEYHKDCMKERGRGALLVIEDGHILPLVPGEREPQAALDRLEAGFPWMNDYYFRTAAKLHGQLFG